MTLDRFWTQWYSGTWPLCQSGIMKRRCEDPLISQTLGFDTYRMGNCIKTDNESKYKIEELTKGNSYFLRDINFIFISYFQPLFLKKILYFLMILILLESFDDMLYLKIMIKMVAFNGHNNECSCVVKWFSNFHSCLLTTADGFLICIMGH